MKHSKASDKTDKDMMFDVNKDHQKIEDDSDYSCHDSIYCFDLTNLYFEKI